MDFNSPLTGPQPIFEGPAAPFGEPLPNGPETPPVAGHEPEPSGLVPAATPCTACGSTAPPDAQGQCPVKTCRAARVGNKLAAIHDGRAKLTAADLTARDALIDRLFAERGGRFALDIVSQLRIEDYATAQVQLAKVTRRLEALGAVSAAGNERKSLVATYTTFSARVERLAAELPPPTTRSSSLSSSLSTSANDETADELIAETTAILRELLAMRDAEKAPSTPVLGAGDRAGGAEAGAGLQREALTKPSGPKDVPAAVTADSEPGPEPQPSPEPDCPFCHRLCVGPDHPAFDVIHWDDPTEVDKRAARATEEMMKQLGKPLPDWYR
jgi:hypothetical protein